MKNTAKKIFLFVALLTALSAFKSDKPAYRIFDKDGKAMKYNKMLKAMAEADIILFGEQHNNPISHWLQLEVTQSLYQDFSGKIVLGAEMFEADNQLLLNEYLSGKIRTKDFEQEARLWNNYKTDYKPLLEFAKDSGLNFIATNIPRRYAAIVHRKGFEGLDTLTISAKKWFAPLPIAYDSTLAGYQKMTAMMKKMGRSHVNANLPKAQAVKDATMAYFILKNLKPRYVFVHFNGAYHSNNHEGIFWYLEKANPNLNILTVTTTEQESVEKLREENLHVADFIIVVNEKMTKTY
jgi:uncharacterized iron-regulated protein